MNITRISLDLAKSVFQVHAVDHNGHCLFSRALKREKMMAFFQNLSHCLIGMEACASSHFWARTLMSMRHEVKLIAPSSSSPTSKATRTTPMMPKRSARNGHGNIHSAAILMRPITLR